MGHRSANIPASQINRSKVSYMKRFTLLPILLCLSVASSAQEQPKAYLVGGAHFDSQWNWDVQTSISEYIPKTIERNLLLLEKYPDYVFNFEGAVKYSWMKEYYPQYWRQIRDYVQEGRWHVSGSTWDANDVNIPSPESFTRNILYGQKFFRDEFGVQGTDIYLPDCFGFGWTLPTVAAHSGLIGFVTQKLTWRKKPFYGDSKIPFGIGLWQGVDGSRIMMVADGHSYVTRWRDEDLSMNAGLAKLASENVNNTLYHIYGTGDTGGSPTMESVLAVQRSVNGEGPLEIISSESDRLFKDYLPYESHPELPVFDGELLMDVHATGCYTSQAAMKLYNRRNELLADAAERSAVMADWSGAVPYPKDFLTEAWRRVLWHQFHDDLPGTCIPRAYEFSWNDEILSLKQFENVLTTSVGGFSRMLDTRVKGTPVVIYNPAGFEVTEVVEISCEGMPDNVTVYDSKGKPAVSQMVHAGGERKLLVRACVPAVGYAVYEVRKGRSPITTTALKATEKEMENSVYRLAFDANGDIASIMDKRNGRELVEEGKAVRLALFTDNRSYTWPAWEIMKEVVDSEPVSITDDVRISVVEKGPLRATVCVERKYGLSVFRQYVSLTDGAMDDRIDIASHIDWRTGNALLKAEFPWSVSNEKAVYDLGVGTIERGNNTDIAYEIYAQQWADLTEEDGNYGVAVMNDCKYGWDKPADNTLRLTLLHTPATRRGRYHYQSRQDLGKHIFTYSIVAHPGDWRKGDVTRKAEILNQPLKAFFARKHDGSCGRTFSFAESLNPNVALRALKQAEDSEAYVVRFYETSGLESQAAEVRFAAGIIEAKELNGNEEVIGEARSEGNILSFDIRPYGMKTYLVRLEKPGAAGAAPYALIDLPYNMKTASYNAFRTEVNFDGRGRAYAAELLPGTITFKGVDFKIGDPALPNAVKCRQDTVALPEGKYDKLYILASATRRDTKVRFTVGGLEQDAVVPYYGGFIGQWGHHGHTKGFIKAADVAWAGTHIHSAVDNKDLPYDFSYLYCITLDVPAGAKSFVLPANQQVVVFAATAVSQGSGIVEPASDILRIGMQPEESGEDVEIFVNLVAGKPVTGKSAEINVRQSASKAVDENTSTKWCDISAATPKYIEVDLEKECLIRGWSVLHAGMESLNYITKEYSFQVRNSPDEDWETVDSVYDNIDQETERLLEQPVIARYVRLNVTKPDQDEGTVARIYEFVVF